MKISNFDVTDVTKLKVCCIDSDISMQIASVRRIDDSLQFMAE
jgi:hypothetical protein